MSSTPSKAISAENGIEETAIHGSNSTLVKLGTEEILLIKEGEQYHAVGASCSHNGAPLQDGMIASGQIRCPWHHARFCLKTGAAVGAPALEPLSLYHVRRHEGRIFLAKTQSQTLASARGSEERRVVIIGAGAAGFACADMLSKLHFDGSIALVNADHDMPYDRTVCSKHYLAGKYERAELFLPNEELLSIPKGSPGHVRLLQHSATALNVNAREVTLDSGERLHFDVLVLANGAEPERLSLPGLDTDRVYVLRTLKDADAIIAAATAAQSVVVVGASFIGLEAAAALRQRKLNVHVIAPDEIPLAKSVGSAVGNMIRTVHEKYGVVFHLGRKLASYAGTKATLDDGTELDADFIVLGTGVRPRTQLAEDAGLAVASSDKGGGVIVNERLETQVSGIFAVGDISRYPNAVTGKPIRIEHWVHAQRQGQFVARRIMGDNDAFEDIPFFWTAHFDTSLRYLGHVNELGEPSVEGNIEAQNFALTFSDATGGEALLTCNQDLKSLETEVLWELNRHPLE